ncbi:MAG: calcium-translocating P-type ATPase, PMCA-type [Bacillota bacterium]|nr:calcium-translocating P-type ATPase, PMCA-type [Bacillota bacterium]
MDNKTRVYKCAQKYLTEYNSDPHAGLTTENVEKNRAQYGKNEITPAQKDPLWKQFVEKFKDPTIIILCICAAISVFIGFYHKEFPWEGIGIFIAISIATGVGFFSEYKADQAFETLKRDNENIQVKVIRNNSLEIVSTRDLVVGDVIEVENGDKVPADAVVINSVDLLVDESLMTGESLAVSKSEDEDKLLGGTVVVSGQGKAIVTAVGEKMQMGEILRSLSRQEEEQTPLQLKLGTLAGLISKVGTTAAILIFFSLFASTLLSGNFGVISSSLKITTAVVLVAIVILSGAGQILGNDKIKRIASIGGPILATIFLIYISFFAITPKNVVTNIQTILDYFIVAVTIIVVAVPEGLPMAVTISLALSMRKIRQDNNLVRKMLATETIGSVNVICSDKTGTLTKNQMEVQEVFFAGQNFNKDSFSKIKEHSYFNILKYLLTVNSTADFIKDDSGKYKVVGNSTEGALLTWIGNMGIDFHQLREETPIYHRVSFTSERKMMASTTGYDTCQNCRIANSGKCCEIAEQCRITYVKGAPEKIIGFCRSIVIDSKIEDINKHKKSLDSFISAMSDKAMRIIALAYKIEASEKFQSSLNVENDLILLGLVGISDPVREDVKEAVNVALSAGIDVKMVTGDNIKTATAIAKEIGLLQGDWAAMEGSEFRTSPDSKILQVLDKLKVLARATPSDKERLVNLIQSSNKVVAVTGDGTNDAPALKKADVGISMGLRGTDVAKEASDIVLTDDNFGSIVKAVKWGRTLYENIQKFLQFQLTINFSALMIAILSPILKLLFPDSNFQALPLTVLQLLWVNLVMDTLAALALGLEPARSNIMQDPPKKRTESFVTKTMLYNILTMGVCFTLFIIGLQAFDIMGASKLSGEFAFSSVLFTTYIFMQVFNMFNARAVKLGTSIFRNLGQSKSFLGVLTGIVVVQILITNFGHSFFHTQPLPLYMWGRIILVGVGALVLGAVFRTLGKGIIKT